MKQDEQHIKNKRRSRKQNRRFTLVAVVAFILVFALSFGGIYAYFRYIKTTPKSTEENNITTEIPQNDDTQEDTENTNTDSVYSDIYYYESDKQERYTAYATANPDLSAQEVVLYVNAYLDYEFYGFDIPVDTYDDPLIIVNKHYRVLEQYRPSDLVECEGYNMRASVRPAYLELKEAAAADGITLYIKSAYRSYDKQESLYNSYVAADGVLEADTYSARPGYSEHHTGYALDITDKPNEKLSNISSALANWFEQNSYKYGFIVRYTADNQWITGYQPEAWHLRYVGTEVSQEMHDKGIGSFEEYKVKFIDHKEG